VISRRAIFFTIALGAKAAVISAVALQYRFDMQPCAWCILQRVIFLAIALVALLGLVWRSRVGAVLSAWLLAGLALCGEAAALWQHFVAASSASCDLTLAERVVSALGLDERWPQVFTAYASCKDAAVKLLGVPFEFWSAALFAATLFAALAVLSNVRRGRVSAVSG
jgi:protein dithiol:quinone oxidoreductase